MLPEKFINRMKNYLGDDFEKFDSALAQPPVHGIRVNEGKCSIEDFKRIFRGELQPLPYAKDGFIPEIQSGLGNTPEHHAGMFYSQDPGAMSAVNAMNLKEGDKVLDACAAPGGKSAQVLAKIGRSGFLLSNEYVPKRAKIIVGNMERLGAVNAMVTSLDTAAFREMFSCYFDAVVCDAPCSGEGMFRKCEEALEDWSEENVASCAKRQLEILGNCAGVLKPGGELLYSTCTYSLEENECVVEEFLANHPEFYLVPVSAEVRSSTVDGILPREDSSEDLRMTRRFYPHISKGEGQFIALMKKRVNIDDKQTILYKDAAKQPSKQEIKIIEDFIKDNFTARLEGRIIKCGDGFALMTHDTPLPPNSVFMSGVMLGEIRGQNFFPHHHLFSAFGTLMKRVENLSVGDGRVEKYLRGEEISSCLNGAQGWCAVCYEGASMGGGKISSGTVKNHYPKGLRKR